MAGGISIQAAPTGNLSMIWRQQYVTEALNRKFKAQPRGIARGFKVVPGAGANTIDLVVDEVTGDSVMVAAPQVGSFAVTYRETGTINLAVPSGDDYYIGLEHDYAIGSDTTATWKYWDQTQYDNGDADDAVIVALVRSTLAATVIDAADIERWVRDDSHRWHGDKGAQGRVIVDQMLLNDSNQSTVPLTISGHTGTTFADSKFVELTFQYDNINLVDAEYLQESIGSYQAVIGEEVFLTGWVKHSAGGIVFDATDTEFRVEFFSALGVSLGDTVCPIVIDTAETDWKAYTGSVKTPATAQYGRVKIKLKWNSGSVAVDLVTAEVDRVASNKEGAVDLLERMYTPARLAQSLWSDPSNANQVVFGLNAAGEWGFFTRGAGSDQEFHWGNASDRFNVRHYGLYEMFQAEAAGSPEFRFRRIDPTIVTANTVGKFSFRGNDPDDNGGLGYEGAFLDVVADGNWSAGVYPTAFEFWHQAIQSLMLASDGGVHMANLKSGASQIAALAIAGELWHDTGDNTIKIGV